MRITVPVAVCSTVINGRVVEWNINAHSFDTDWPQWTPTSPWEGIEMPPMQLTLFACGKP